MARNNGSPDRDASGSPKRLAMGLLVSISALVSLYAKKASRVSRKLKTKSMNSKAEVVERPKRLLTTISSKAKNFGVHKRKNVEEEEEEWGDGGVWQKTILMGDKCQPLDFSGVIYYDSNGKQMNELPLRSPRASPLPGYLQK